MTEQLQMERIDEPRRSSVTTKVELNTINTQLSTPKIAVIEAEKPGVKTSFTDVDHNSSVLSSQSNTTEVSIRKRKIGQISKAKSGEINLSVQISSSLPSESCESDADSPYEESIEIMKPTARKVPRLSPSFMTTGSSTSLDERQSLSDDAASISCSPQGIKSVMNHDIIGSVDVKHTSPSLYHGKSRQTDRKKELAASVNGLDGKTERPTPVGSELTTAAYNNFVRRVVDDTLDRTITFCEQPRYAISALENICAKAWPHFEVKRHRTRIRAYLKACRRNSKKNRGQINMKEPPMNGLSIEARQLVLSALNLVSDDVDQLKTSLSCEGFKNKSAPNATISHTKTEPYIPRPQLSNNSPPTLNYTSSFTEGLTESDVCNSSSEPSDLEKSGRPIPPAYFNPFTCSQSVPQFDQAYLTAMFRLLPSMFQLNAAQTFQHPFHSINGSGAFVDLTLKADPNTQHYTNTMPHINTTMYSNRTQPNTKFDARLMNTNHSERAMDCLEAPPAHIASIQYSPSLNEATGKLLDTRILTQDDVAYFLHNLEVAQEAIRYAKGISRLIMKKAELLEGQIRNSINGFCPNPLNLS